MPLLTSLRVVVLLLLLLLLWMLLSRWSVESHVYVQVVTAHFHVISLLFLLYHYGIERFSCLSKMLWPLHTKTELRLFQLFCPIIRFTFHRLSLPIVVKSCDYGSNVVWFRCTKCCGLYLIVSIACLLLQASVTGQCKPFL